MEQIRIVGLDIAKSIFQVHGVDEAGEVVLRRRLRRSRVLPFFASIARCRIGIEACATAHYWARELRALGHDVRLMPPSYVKPYVKRQKNDAADAEAICEAVSRPTMRFVPVKTVEQQGVMVLHRSRELLMRQRHRLSCIQFRNRCSPSFLDAEGLPKVRARKGYILSLGHYYECPAALAHLKPVAGPFLRRGGFDLNQRRVTTIATKLMVWVRPKSSRLLSSILPSVLAHPHRWISLPVCPASAGLLFAVMII